MSALLPCPWCGGQVVESVSEGSTFRWRKFDGCCADGPEVRHNTTADDQAAAEVESRAKAIAAWNERVTPPAAAPDEAMVRLVEKVQAAHRATHPVAKETLIAEAAALTAALTGVAK